MNNHFRGTVIQGQKLGRTIGYPTINLKDPTVMQDKKEGVYASKVTIDEETFAGALYYGPRLVLNESKVVLEIFLLNFNKDVYGKEVEIELFDFIRPVMNFSSLEELKIQLQKDCLSVATLLE